MKGFIFLKYMVQKNKNVNPGLTLNDEESYKLLQQILRATNTFYKETNDKKDELKAQKILDKISF